MRKLVTIETVAEVRRIPDADAIEAAIIRGWIVVAKKGKFAAGDQCAYFEIDAALPLADKRFAFLGTRGTNTTVTGEKVHVLKTARLRGVYSQGLVLPLAQFPEFNPEHHDLAVLVNVEKWEPPLPAALGGDMLGAFPTALARKTDAERAQNLVEVFAALRDRHEWIATEKLDGTTQGPWQTRGRVRLLHLRTVIPLAEWPTWVSEIAAPRVGIDMSTYETVESLIAVVDGMKSSVAPARLAEGVVFQTADGAELPELDYRGCFKVISNRYLLKHP